VTTCVHIAELCHDMLTWKLRPSIYIFAPHYSIWLRYDIAQNYIIPHTHTSKFSIFTVLKNLKQHNYSNKTCTYINDLLLTKFNLSKCNDLWVISIKRNTNFKFQLPSMFLYFIFQKNGRNKVHALKIYQHTKLNGPTFTSSGFASTSEVWISTILE
jgi:hypothetical protein